MDENTPETPEGTPVSALPKAAKDTGRYSAYDTLEARYVGGVHDSEAKAKAAAKAKGITGDRVRVIEV